MARSDRAVLEDAVLPALAARLEQALDLVASAEAVLNLEQIAHLCEEAADLASAGKLLLG